MANSVIYPADTVDAGGKSWPTVGENIRNGNNVDFESLAYHLINIMFPVGSVYSGENEMILSVGHWELVAPGGKFLVSGTVSATGEVVEIAQYPETTTKGDFMALRLWRRTS